MPVREDPAPRSVSTPADAAPRSRSPVPPAGVESRSVRLAGTPVVRWCLDHSVWTTFVVALLLRVALAAAVAVVRGGTLFLDDVTYVRLAQAIADGRLHTLDVESRFVWDRTKALLAPLVLLDRALGHAGLAGHLYVALFGAVTAALVA